MGTGKSIAKSQLVCTMKTDIEPIAKVFIPKECKQLVLASNGRVEIFNTHTGKSVKKYSLRCRPKAMAFNKNGKYLLVGQSTTICLIDYAKESIIKEFEVTERITCLNNSILAYSQDGRHITGILPVGTFRWRSDTKRGAPEGHKLSLNCLQGLCSVSPDLDYIAVLEGDSYCKVLRLKPDVEWCRLGGHKEAVTCADFGSTSKYLLLATGSKDHMVRLWDAGSFTGHVAAKTEHHTGRVTGCLFSPDKTKAVSSSKADGAWLWDCTVTPPRISLFLVSKSTCGELLKVSCISDDGDFVAGFCNDNDIDVWNTNSQRLSNKISIEAVHRMMPYVNPQYFFLTFNQALLACFMTSNRFGVVFLEEVASEMCLKDWHDNPDKDPGFLEYTQKVLEFDHTCSYKVMDAALRYDGAQLVTITKKLAEANLLDTLITRKKEPYMDGEVVINIWNVYSQEIILKCTVADKLTRFHCVDFLTNYPMVFMQEEFKTTNVARPRTALERGRTVKLSSCTVTRILNPELGDILGKLTIQGEYETLTIPDGSTLQGKTLHEAMERIKISCMTREGVFMSTNLIKNNPMAKFVLKGSIATAYAFSSDNQTAVVGFDTGAVRFLRLDNIKKTSFLGKS